MRLSQAPPEIVHHPSEVETAARVGATQISSLPNRWRAKIESPTKSPTSVRILVVHASPLARLGLAAIARSQRRFKICAETDDVPAAREMIVRYEPALVVLGLTLRRGDGIELLKDLSKLHPPARRLVLTKRDQPLVVQRAFRAGAHGYLLVSDQTAEILQAFNRVLAGELYASTSVSRGLVENLTRRTVKRDDGQLSSLSDREFQVFSLFGRGLGVTRLAAELRLSVKTVETHQMRIKEKLGLRSAAELCAQAALWMSRVVSQQPSMAR
jgi:DNA-binding NarL/FixJ family response regulator